MTLREWLDGDDLTHFLDGDYISFENGVEIEKINGFWFNVENPAAIINIEKMLDCAVLHINCED